MKRSAEQQLELIRKHTVDLLPEEELLEKLRSACPPRGRPLRVKLGVDASGPDIHVAAARHNASLEDHRAIGCLSEYTLASRLAADV